MNVDTRCGIQRCVAAATKKCSACGEKWYCSREHQAADWKDHRDQCPGAFGAFLVDPDKQTVIPLQLPVRDPVRDRKLARERFVAISVATGIPDAMTRAIPDEHLDAIIDASLFHALHLHAFASERLGCLRVCEALIGRRYLALQQDFADESEYALVGSTFKGTSTSGSYILCRLDQAVFPKPTTITFEDYVQGRRYAVREDAETMERRCNACGSFAFAMQCCARCNQAFYCNKECQVQDRAAHKSVCYRKGWG